MKKIIVFQPSVNKLQVFNAIYHYDPEKFGILNNNKICDIGLNILA